MPADKSDLLHGTLDFIVLKTLHAMGPLHGYAIARRIEQVSADQLAINQGTLYPALLKLQQHGWITSQVGGIEHWAPREGLLDHAPRRTTTHRRSR